MTNVLTIRPCRGGRRRAATEIRDAFDDGVETFPLAKGPRGTVRGAPCAALAEGDAAIPACDPHGKGTPAAGRSARDRPRALRGGHRPRDRARPEARRSSSPPVLSSAGHLCRSRISLAETFLGRPAARNPEREDVR